MALSAHPKGIGLQILWVPRLQYDVDRLYLSTWREMARELEDRGHSVRVAVAGIPRSETPAGWIRLPLVPVKGLRLAGFWLAGYLTTTWQVLRGRPDVVLLDVHTAGFALPLVWRCRRILWLVDCRAPIQHTSVRRSRARQVFERALNRIAFGLAGRILDGVTVDTNYYRQLVADRHSVSPERMGVWGSGADLTGFDPERVRPVSRPVDLRERFIVFQHGELSFNRGLLETVRALAEPGLENVALVLLGQGPAREEIARTAAECGVAERLRILPPVRYGEVPAHIAGCDCAVMAYPVDEYWNCCHPIKYVEYLAMGKVVISTPLAVMREAGSDAPFLEFIPDNRPGSIAAGIRRCMDDPNRAARGRAGIAHARAHGSWGAQAERLLEFIHARQEARRRP